MENHKLLSKNQFGFKPGISTENALFSTTEFIYNELDSSNKGLAMFLDLAKAFDTVNHEILLQILPSFGIDKMCIAWFKGISITGDKWLRLTMYVAKKV